MYREPQYRQNVSPDINMINLDPSNSILLQCSNKKSLVTVGDLSLMWAAPRLWNALPATQRNITCLEPFKKTLKVTVQFERCFRLMEHISVISCRNPINLYITEKHIKFSKSLFNIYLVISNK